MRLLRIVYAGDTYNFYRNNHNHDSINHDRHDAQIDGKIQILVTKTPSGMATKWCMAMATASRWPMT